MPFREGIEKILDIVADYGIICVQDITGLIKEIL
jgi:hypothetical protein